ncbi:hypothetical protein QO239_12815, partial [Cupriavidus taiwanensis]|uniref:hypothetical protein n=1 Tax=Cupriavidus taiwanensis TaxID=164546 RepID=UPI00253FF36C
LAARGFVFGAARTLWRSPLFSCCIAGRGAFLLGPPSAMFDPQVPTPGTKAVATGVCSKQ